MVDFLIARLDRNERGALPRAVRLHVIGGTARKCDSLVAACSGPVIVCRPKAAQTTTSRARVVGHRRIAKRSKLAELAADLL